MGPISSSAILSLLSLLVLSISCPTTSSLSSVHENSVHEDFIKCIHLQKPPNSIPIYPPNNSSYSSLLHSSARNLRFLSDTFHKPQFIITPLHESHVQEAVVCSRKHGLDIKVRSGGHDVEGLSFTSDAPFIILDLINFRSINVDVETKTAWVQAGANLGEVYYRIAEKSKTLGFPAGFCPTVGVGGHLSGGGLGALVRKYGTAADQVIDAHIVNVNGEILNKETMGEDLFWAIRGGGASSFGIILSWKIKLVPVPAIITVATVDKTLEQGAIDLVHRWQFIADRLHEDLYLSLIITVVPVNASQPGVKGLTIARFSAMFLGRVDKLLQLMEESFPELGLKRNDCNEMSWVESHVYFYARGQPVEYLLDRNDPISKIYLKAKSDNIKVPISKDGLMGLWRRLGQEDMPVLLLSPYGGRMNEISESEVPFPHRVGNIYNICYNVNWFQASQTAKHIEWVRKLYKYMTPYVSNSPRTAYLNYRDLDLGQYMNGKVSYSKARVWGTKYFKMNFERLVNVKTNVDPHNFFKNKQSIPPRN